MCKFGKELQAVSLHEKTEQSVWNNHFYKIGVCVFVFAYVCIKKLWREMVKLITAVTFVWEGVGALGLGSGWERDEVGGDFSLQTFLK